MLRAWQYSADIITMIRTALPGGAARARVEKISDHSFTLYTGAPDCGSGSVVWQSARTLAKHMSTQPSLKGARVLELGAGTGLNSLIHAPSSRLAIWGCTGFLSFTACCLGASKAVATEQGLFTLPGHLPNKHKVPGTVTAQQQYGGGIVKLLKRNVEANAKLNVVVEELLWGDGRAVMNVAAHGPYTHIIGSDLVYDDNSWPHLLATLKALTHDEVDAHIACRWHRDPVRPHAFFEECGLQTIVWLAFPDRPTGSGFVELAERNGFVTHNLMEQHPRGYILVYELRQRLGAL